MRQRAVQQVQRRRPWRGVALRALDLALQPPSCMRFGPTGSARAGSSAVAVRCLRRVGSHNTGRPHVHHCSSSSQLTLSPLPAPARSCPTLPRSAPPPTRPRTPTGSRPRRCGCCTWQARCVSQLPVAQSLVCAHGERVVFPWPPLAWPPACYEALHLVTHPYAMATPTRCPLPQIILPKASARPWACPQAPAPPACAAATPTHLQQHNPTPSATPDHPTKQRTRAPGSRPIHRRLRRRHGWHRGRPVYRHRPSA